jgi:hypothetical protein
LLQVFGNKNQTQNISPETKGKPSWLDYYWSQLGNKGGRKRGLGNDHPFPPIHYTLALAILCRRYLRVMIDVEARRRAGIFEQSMGAKN